MLFLEYLHTGKTLTAHALGCTDKENWFRALSARLIKGSEKVGSAEYPYVTFKIKDADWLEKQPSIYEENKRENSIRTLEEDDRESPDAR